VLSLLGASQIELTVNAVAPVHIQESFWWPAFRSIWWNTSCQCNTNTKSL